MPSLRRKTCFPVSCSLCKTFRFCCVFSSLLAVCLDDFEIHVVDIDMRRVVRIFRGHTNRITDMVSAAPLFKYRYNHTSCSVSLP